MKKLLLAAAVSLVLCPLTASAAHINPGKWEVTMTMDMPGMPMKMPAQTFSHCITKEQAEKPEPPKSPRQSDCEMYDYKIDGNVVTYKMKCSKQNITAEGKMTFGENSYEILTHMKMGDQEVTQKMNGKRVGECDSK